MTQLEHVPAHFVNVPDGSQNVPAHDAVRTQSEPFAAVSAAFCSSIANPNCPSCTRGLSSASCRVLLRRTRPRRFTRITAQRHWRFSLKHIKKNELKLSRTRLSTSINAHSCEFKLAKLVVFKYHKSPKVPVNSLTAFWEEPSAHLSSFSRHSFAK